MTAAWNQLIGIGAILTLAFVPTFAFFFCLKRMCILRVSEILEIVGLDYLEQETLH